MKSPTARRIVQYWADLRPAWLWSQDGASLLWRNAAARYFTARLKKTGLRLNPEAVPIRGQVPRLIRLGTAGRSSLSRVQFLAGEKPVATTCSCTPLAMPDGTMALLLVAIDPLPAELLAAIGPLADDAAVTDLLPAGADYLLTDGAQAVRGSAAALADRAPALAETGLPDENDDLLRFTAGPGDATLLVYLPRGAAAARDIAAIRADEGESADDALPSDQDLASTPEPLLPLGLETVPEAESAPPPSDEWVEPLPPPPPERALSSLFDRLAEDATLYAALSPADETFAVPPAEAAAEPPSGSQPPLDHEMVAAVIDYADDPESSTPEPTPAPEPAAPTGGSASQWLITGRGFRALAPKPPIEPEAPPPEPAVAAPEPEAPSAAAEPLVSAEPAAVAIEPPAPAAIDEAADAETAERVSRYNFEELGRILTDRVSGEPAPPSDIAPTAPRAAAAPEGVINLNAETLVLNRLPLAILVFRDQQVLFANRALMDLLGHDSAQGLRSAGIASIFPNDEAHGAGPVNRLVRRDGTPLPVSARLQSVSWQGRAALMLSASPAEAIRTHEGAVRAFAELAAEAREEGFVLADRAGNITHLSGTAGALLGRAVDELAGKPLALLVGRADMEPLRQFLEKPARFTETARPSVLMRSEDGSTDIALFAEGQAGIVTGYFGFLSRRHNIMPEAAATADAEIEPGMLGRLSRGIRRPLNSIIGFADLMRAAPGQLDAARYAEYARDIRTAGLEIAVLVDELDDFTRLRDGQYAPRPSDVDLTALLEGCVARVRTQASAARVLVRSAISEALPRVRADRTSLAQALLNLLASAIDQTPIGGSVILSAQTDEEGNIAIHVRDGAQNGVDLGERFVVFRDGIDKDGTELAPVRSSVGLALTRSLLAVNACSLSVDPTIGTGTLFSLRIPADLVVKS